MGKLHNIKPQPSQPRIDPLPIPDGFKLVVDTREQLPLCMDTPSLNIIKTKLDIGDYSVLGFEDMFSIERKIMSDFDSFIGREYRDKTIHKLVNMSNLKWAGLVIEADLKELLSGGLYSKIKPNQRRGFLNSVRVRHGIHVFHSGVRAECEMWVLDSAVKFYNIMREGRKIASRFNSGRI